ncbi:MAG: hypothetical protein LBK60_11435 [Verrucomicrobiales bacterium]|nr:hypothetical protein [Verrucomicrobiales bacterium]
MPKTPADRQPVATIYDATKDAIWRRRPITISEFGILRFRLDAKHAAHPLNEDGVGLTYKELHNHTSINGASGAGKTAFVFNQLIEASFRAGDLKKPGDWSRLKPGYFVQDGKMELPALVEWCAHKYGRAGDIDKIGPDGPDSAAVDPFNNPAIPVRQYADMMTTLANANRLMKL